MGDSRRFQVFGDFISNLNLIKKEDTIADIAGGRGYLQLALREKGFKSVITYDTRHNFIAHSYRHQWFNYNTAPSNYKLVVGMHPDEGTDHIVAYAVKHRIPFIICPCCIKPSAHSYFGMHKIEDWLVHLQLLASKGKMHVERHNLKISGRNAVLVGWPLQ